LVVIAHPGIKVSSYRQTGSRLRILTSLNEFAILEEELASRRSKDQRASRDYPYSLLAEPTVLKISPGKREDECKYKRARDATPSEPPPAD
jgi:hypothetical protein